MMDPTNVAPEEFSLTGIDESTALEAALEETDIRCGITSTLAGNCTFWFPASPAVRDTLSRLRQHELRLDPLVLFEVRRQIVAAMERAKAHAWDAATMEERAAYEWQRQNA